MSVMRKIAIFIIVAILFGGASFGLTNFREKGASTNLEENKITEQKTENPLFTTKNGEPKEDLYKLGNTDRFLVKSESINTNEIAPKENTEIEPVKDVASTDTKTETKDERSIFEKYLAEIAPVINVKVSEDKISKAEKNKDGIPLLLRESIEKAISSGNFSEAKNTLAFYKEISDKKILALAGLTLPKEYAAFHEKMLSSEKSTSDLITYMQNVADGKASLDSAKQKYSEFEKSMDSTRKDFVALKNKDGLFSKYRVSKAEAAVPFGGMVSFTMPCTCDAGLAITVGPPVGGQFYASYGFMASPLLFPFKQLHIGAWVLGVFTPAPSCFMFIGLACTPTAGQIMTIAGTSI